ncbi:MAG: DNA-binding protein [Conexibacter sp.]|nr:DNA-binding protein [Conexibacter sp.]
MTAAEVAAILRMPKSTVYALARCGELPCARLGRTMRFLREDIEARLRRSHLIDPAPSERQLAGDADRTP